VCTGVAGFCDRAFVDLCLAMTASLRPWHERRTSATVARGHDTNRFR
jgi:hypothetical protein